MATATSRKQETFLDYEGFVEKFKPKKTTDDCYTPPAIYQAVVDYVNEFVCPLEGLTIERPFKPNGDYQRDAERYDEKTIVIDNPPFSILSEIKRFYLSREIKFFLFAPQLTLFTSSHQDLSYIITDSRLTYENGAKVNTSFVTNLLGDTLIKVCPVLHNRLKEADRVNRAKKAKPKLPKYRYCDNVISSAILGKYATQGVSFEVKKSEAIHTRGLDSQKPYKKTIFGSGYIITDEKAQELKAQEDNCCVWGLSPRERELLDYVSKNKK